jgi:ribonuclease III
MLENEIIQELEKAIFYEFNDKNLLLKALVHKSYLSEKKRNPEIIESNERLEFLGDAVLELIVTEFLYKNYKDDEGYLTSLRAALVNFRLIGEVGQSIGLEDKILLSSGEKLELGKARLTIVADTLEAILGAMYLDGGYKIANDFVEKFILTKLDEIIKNKTFKDPKTRLQEEIQKNYHQTPKYNVINSVGKDHEKKFLVGVSINNQIIAQSWGNSKQEAQTNAAALVLDKIEKNELII